MTDKRTIDIAVAHAACCGYDLAEEELADLRARVHELTEWKDRALELGMEQIEHRRAYEKHFYGETTSTDTADCSHVIAAQELADLRAQVAALTAERDALAKRIADAPVVDVSEDADGYEVIWDCGDYKRGDFVRLVKEYAR